MTALNGRHILLGISGGIAAYKSAYLCRRLKDAGADVWVAMTPNATRFITPLTMETLSEREVLIEMFPDNRFVGTRHIDVSDWTDLAIVAPATANLLGRYAAGLADDLLATLLISTTAPVLLAPAMNTDMYNHPAVRENLETLRRRGAHFVAPGVGMLACHTYGVGRMAEPEEIVQAAAALLSSAAKQDLAEKTILVTAGPTVEPIDPVRVLTNRSSGKMGYAIAETARQRGARVVLISGPTALPTPAGVERIDVETAEQMHQAAVAQFPGCDAAVAVAAVSDWRIADPSPGKLSKNDGPPNLVFEETPDILGALGRMKTDQQYLAGFSLETDEVKLQSDDKMRARNLDLLVANNPTAPGIEFGGDYNEVFLITPDGRREPTGRLTKIDLAGMICDRIASGLAQTTPSPVRPA